MKKDTLLVANPHEGLDQEPQTIDLDIWLNYLRVRYQKMDLATFEKYWCIKDRGVFEKICGCGRSTVDHWFTTGYTHRPPNEDHEMRLAEAHNYFLTLKKMPRKYRESMDLILLRPPSVN